MAKRDQAEFRLHCFVADLLQRTAWPHIVYWHTPNGENRGAVTGARLKRMGVLKGVADFTFIMDGPIVAFLELKAPQKYLSPDQRTFRDRVTQHKAWYAIARTGDEARAILSDWGVTRETFKRPSAVVGEIIHGDGVLS